MNTVLLFDTETTGKDEARQPVEIAYLGFRRVVDLAGAADSIPEPLSIDASFSCRYKPTVPVTLGSLAVHHILPEELEACEGPDTFKLPEGVEYLIGHSIDFDWETIGKPKVKRICTLAMARRIWPEADSHSQSALIYLLNGATMNTRRQLQHAHSALVDVENCMALLEHILQAKPEIRTWSALWRFSEEARIPTHMPMGRNKGAPITQLESGEMEWYLDRGIGDPYLHKAFHQELRRRRGMEPAAAGDEDDYIYL